jgi:hypothetical protein
VQYQDAGVDLQPDPRDADAARSAATGANEPGPRWRLPLASLAGVLALCGIASADAQPAESPLPVSVPQVNTELDALDPALWPTDPFAAHTQPRPRDRHRERVTRAIRLMVAAGNRIATLPYSWGGGHGSFTASGYDCSGSVSFVLHAAGLLATPEDSGALMSYGQPGPGRYVTIYSNPEHAFVTIRGRRFDTIAFQETGTRWSSTIGSTAGYTVRHPRGL